MKGNPVVVKGFDGHYPDTRDGQIPENGFASLENILVTTGGTLKPRPGISTIGSVGFRLGDIKGIYTLSNGTRKWIIDEFNGAALGVTELAEDGDSSTTIINGTACGLFLQWQDIGFIFSEDPSVNLKTWDGSLSTPAIDVQGNVGLVHKSRMFVVNNSSGGLDNTVVRYSEIFDLEAPDTVAGWPANNTINISADDGDYVSAMALLNDTLIVFKRFSTWAVYVEGLPPWTVRNLHPNIGCVGRDTAIVIGGLLYFRAANGVYRTDGTTFELLSGPIKEYLDDDLGMASNECNSRSAVWWGDYYLLNDWRSGRTDTFLEAYNIDNGAWSRLVFDEAGSVQKLRWFQDREATPPKLFTMEYVTGSDTGNLQEFSELNDYTDVGTAVTYEIVSKMYDFDKPSDWKLVREIDFEVAIENPFGSFSMSVDVVSERATTAVQNKTVEGQQRSVVRARGPMRCRAVRYTATFQLANDEVEINQVVFDVQVIGAVGVAH